MATNDPALAILRARIRIALRRGTGQMLDVDARLADPVAAAAALAEWRQLGLPDLNALLDQYVQRASGPAPAAAAPERHASGPALAAGRGVAAAPGAPAVDGPPQPEPPDPAGPPGKGARRYLHGAR